MLHAIVGPHWRRAGPHLPIQVIRRVAVLGVRAGACAVIAVNLHQADLAQLAFLDDGVPGFDEMRCAAALGADLDDALVFAGRGEHGLAFDDIHADRFLHIDIGAGLDRGNHRQGVPMVGRGDQDDVEVPFLEHLAIIRVSARLLFRELAGGDDFGCLRKHVLIDIAERDDLDRRDLNQTEQVTLAIPAAADQTNALLPAWELCGIAAQG